jgi:hypothetical protein
MSLTGPAVDSILAQPGQGMAAQHNDRTISQVEQEEYECVTLCWTDNGSAIDADVCVCSYESLPPNFSLAANMVAGAFAGIAVSPHSPRRDGET